MPPQLNLILIGPPGAGKGTQADRLREDFRLPFISTGEMLRTNVKEGTELGRAAKAHMDAGGLVPDDLIVAMAAERLDEDDTQDGFILDGFPRTTAQAEALEEQLDSEGRRITAAVLLAVPDAEIIKRIAGRRVCVKAGHNYHVDYDPPKNPGVLRPGRLAPRSSATTTGPRSWRSASPSTTIRRPRLSASTTSAGCCGASTGRVRRRRSTITSAR